MTSPAAARSIFSGQIKKTPSNITFCSPFVRKVCLHNWWLIKVGRDSKGRRGLGVGGFASREGQETRAFFSTAIVKRHDTVTLETTDGITITISGFIDRSHTVENGFPPEVVNRFCFGFPYDWEEYAGQFCSEESVNGAIPSSISNLGGVDNSSVDGTDGSLPFCLDDIPVTRVRDILMSSGADFGVFGKSIVNDIMQYCGGNETVDDNCIDDGSTQHSIDRGRLEFQKTSGECEMGIEVNCLSRGVMTRSMSRLSTSRNTKEKNLSPKIHATNRNTEVYGDQCGGAASKGNDSSKRRMIIFPNAEGEAGGTPTNRHTKVYGDQCGGTATRGNDSSKRRRIIFSNAEGEAGGTQTNRHTEVYGDQCGGTASKGNDSSKRRGIIFSNAEGEASGTPHIYTVRRYSRPESLSEPLPKSEVSNNHYGGAVSREEMNVKQKSAVRRSDRLRKIYN